MHASAGPLEIMFVLRDPGRIRYFEPALEILAERGHSVRLVIERYRAQLDGQWDFAKDLEDRYTNVVIEPGCKREKDDIAALVRDLRLGLDHLHYLKLDFDDAPAFRRRAAEASPPFVRELVDRHCVEEGGRDALEAALAGVEAELPGSTAIESFVADRRPDVLLVTPLVWFGAPQTDWVRAARTLGIRTGACIFSWDNLTSKGAMREVPDFITLWNPGQRREAVELHGVPVERIVVTGAQNWDHWFDWQPARDREEFCREVGLRSDRPYVLWLESSGYVGDETEYVRKWIRSLRKQGGERTSSTGVLVRPHPQAVHTEWRPEDFDGFKNVSIWPPEGRVPLDSRSRSDFFDSIHHSAAVVGVNTSAFIESAILDRPCLTLLDESFRKGQEGTIHFHHLLHENGGPLRAARSLDEHLEQIERALAEPGGQARPFLERFVRPHGLGVPAAPLVADAIERAGMEAPRPVEGGRFDPEIRSQIREAVERDYSLNLALAT